MTLVVYSYMLSLISNIRTSRYYSSKRNKGFRKNIENFSTDEILPSQFEVSNCISSKDWIETYR